LDQETMDDSSDLNDSARETAVIKLQYLYRRRRKSLRKKKEVAKVAPKEVQSSIFKLDETNPNFCDICGVTGFSDKTIHQQQQLHIERVSKYEECQEVFKIVIQVRRQQVLDANDRMIELLNKISDDNIVEYNSVLEGLLRVLNEKSIERQLKKQRDRTSYVWGPLCDYLQELFLHDHTANCSIQSASTIATDNSKVTTFSPIRTP